MTLALEASRRAFVRNPVASAAAVRENRDRLLSGPSTVERMAPTMRSPSKAGLVMMRVRIWCTMSNISASPE